MKIDDKLVCLKTIKNLFGWDLFIKGNIYTILYVNKNDITLDHMLYGNEYMEFDKEFVEKNFVVYG